MATSLQINGYDVAGSSSVLTAEALEFVAWLETTFGERRRELLQARVSRQAEIDAGNMPGFLSETASIRESDWSVASAPPDLNDRRVEITGPAERKMLINALNSGSKVFMADIEDSLSPTWENVVQGQVNLRDAVRRTISFENPDGRQYTLNEETATLVVRPRGWHLDERHATLDGQSVSASLFDFGLYFFHNAQELLDRDSGPYFYLPKLQGHQEARLWNDVFVAAQERLGIPTGTIRATVLIEHILAAFEMDEILYELREHAAGLNAGRWDYIFSMIKTFPERSDMVLPDRAEVTMTVPFMRAYTELLVKTCHQRGAHAIGGMAAFIPTRRDPDVNAAALSKVREDKEREASAGFDGSWVAHPGLVDICRDAFDQALSDQPHQKSKLREDVQVEGTSLIDTTIPGSAITSNGVRNNVSVGLQYINAWLNGVGAAAIYNLMEDAATAEISRTQLWQWLRHGVELEDGTTFSREDYVRIRDEELEKLGGSENQRFGEAAEILDQLVLADECAPFLTTLAYERLA